MKEVEGVLQGKLEQILGLQKKVRHLEGQLAAHHDSLPSSYLSGHSATLPARSRSHHNLADQSGNLQKQVNDLKVSLASTSALTCLLQFFSHHCSNEEKSQYFSYFFKGKKVIERVNHCCLSIAILYI